MVNLMSDERHPQAVYGPYLGVSIEPDRDPLPPPVNGSVFHYSSAAGLHGALENKRVYVSHSATMNDPLEGKFGWSVIRERYAIHPPGGHEEFADEFAEMLSEDEESRSWESPSFVLSASTLSDDLNQYRLYGMYQLALAGGDWQLEPSGPYAVREPPNRATWREVLYGAEDAAPYVDHMLRFALRIMQAADPEDFQDTGLVASLAVHVLALHIKHEAYSHEHEVRLVFAVSDSEWDVFTGVRTSRDRLIPFVKAHNGDDTEGFLLGVFLGPTAVGHANAAAIRQMQRTSFPRSTYSGLMTDFPVEESRIQYRE